MPASPSRDPRVVLVREKYFSLRPQPLEQWLWRQGLPAAAERVFWVHWEAGMRAGDWCSQIPIRLVAARCCLDPSTVTRAYQVLGRLGLIRREDPGRDPANPFQQATAITEVRIPRELLVELDRAPNRRTRGAAASEPPAAGTPEPKHNAPGTERVADAPPAPAGHLRFRDYQRIIGRLSAAEKTRYDMAWAESTGEMTFDEGTALSDDEQAHVRWQLHLRAKPPAESTPSAAPVAAARATPAGPRRLPALEAARLRRRLSEAVAGVDLPETFRQVLWSVEEGALRRFDLPLATNIALKKIREGAWTRPNRMPPNWLRPLLQDAAPETCAAA